MTDQKIEERLRDCQELISANCNDHVMEKVNLTIGEAINELDRLKALLDRYRYVVSFASADSWDFGIDTRERIKWAKATDDDLLDWSHDKVAEIAAQYHTAKPDAPVRTTLKASGTFSDGVEAAAKAVLPVLRHYKLHNMVMDDGSDDPYPLVDLLTPGENVPIDGGIEEIENLASEIEDAIRALSPQPRPDAQAQREALAEFCYGKGYNDAQWHKDGKTATELVKAFDRRHHEHENL